MQIRALLFDYGGTLDGHGHWGARFAELYHRAGIELPPTVLRGAFERAEAAVYASPAVRQASLRDIIELHVDTQLAALDLRRPELRRALANRFVTDSEAALARSRSLLTKLAPRFALGVVSNFYGNVTRILTDAGFAPLLSVIVDSNIVGIAKPQPGIFAHAVRALGSTAPETMHVGDSYERDVLAARGAGLRTAWLAAETERVAECVADLRIRSLDDLPSRLAALNGGWRA